MCDDSINNANAVEAFYAAGELNHSDMVKSFTKAAGGNMTTLAPFNYGHKGATVKDMMVFALNDKGGVTIESLFTYVAKQANEGCDESAAMLEAMADQFIWRTT